MLAALAPRACPFRCRSYCDLYTAHTDVPAEFQYFGTSTWGGYYTSPDFCPKYWLGSASHQCRFAQYAPASNSKAEK